MYYKDVESEVNNLKSTPKLKVRSTRRLKHLIAMAGLSSKGMAENVDITPAYASAIVNGGSYPSPVLAGRIVSLLNSHLNTNFLINDLFFDLSVKKNVTPIKNRKRVNE